MWVVGDACTDGSDGRRRGDRRPAVPLDEPGEELGLAGRPEQRGAAPCARPVRRLPRARRPLVPVASRDARRDRLERGRLVRARPRGPARARVRRRERPAAPRRDVSRPLRAADQLAGRTVAARAHRAVARAPLDRARGRPRRRSIRIVATGARIACVPRLTTVKFPSPLWRAYAPDAPRPQIAMSQELARDAGTLAARLLCEVAAEHARATLPTWGPPRRCSGATRPSAPGPPWARRCARWSTRRSSGTLSAGGSSASAAASPSAAACIPAEPRPTTPEWSANHSGMVNEPLRSGWLTTPESWRYRLLESMCSCREHAVRAKGRTRLSPPVRRLLSAR